MFKQNIAAQITTAVAGALLLMTSFASSVTAKNTCTISSIATANLCPFCSALNLTFAQQMNKSDIVVIAKVTNIPKPSDDIDAPMPRASFEISQVLKGQRFVAPEMEFNSLLIGTYELGQEFLVMGSDPPAVIWEAPMRATDRVVNYVTLIQDLPDEGVERLRFFQDYFEDSESILAFDAYDEFASAPYEALVELQDHMSKEKLIKWIKDPETAVNRRRLYFVMLGVCGDESDTEFLEEFIVSGDRDKQAGLDSLLACYLNLKKEAGVELVESTFITDKEVDYVDTLAAVSALRFHGTEVDFIPKQRIVAAIRQLLDRPKMADMIIPDLARWEDWSVMDKLVKMFKDADEDTNWLRVPVISYLQACPDPVAKKHIEELRKIDPDAVRRAEFFAEFDDLDSGDTDIDDGWEDESDDGREDEDDSDSPAADETEEVEKAGSETRNPNPESAGQAQTYISTVPVQNGNQIGETNQAGEKTADAIPDQLAGDAELIPADINPAMDSQSIEKVSNSTAVVPEPMPKGTKVAKTTVESAPVAQATPTYKNLTLSIIFVPMLISGGIFVLLWSVIHGWFERLIF